MLIHRALDRLANLRSSVVIDWANLRWQERAADRRGVSFEVQRRRLQPARRSSADVAVAPDLQIVRR